MKRVITLTMSCLLFISLSVCNLAMTDVHAEGRDTVYIGVDGDCGSLDPYVVSGNFLNVMNAYSEPLWEYNGTTEGFASRFILAESVDTISDTEYIIHLRQGVTFSNGSPFDAKDVLFSLQKTLELRPYYIPAFDVENTYAEDDYTVHLFMSYYDKTAMTAFLNIPIIDAETYDPDTSGTNPIGTGPYVVTDYVVNSSVTLTARDDYWGGEPPIKTVVYKNIPESSQKVNALETGEIDVLMKVPNEDIEYVMNMPGKDVIQRATVDQVMITINGCKGSPFETKEARWALAYAINREGVVAVALNGNGTVAQAPFSSGCSDFSEDIANMHDTYSTGYNLELAKKYAEESGLVGKTVRLVTNGSDVYVTTAQIIEQALKEIGVDAHVENFDQATVRNMIAGEEGWEVYVSWTSNPSGLGSDMICAQISKFNRSHFDWDEESFALLNDMGMAALATSDPEEYQKLLKEYLEVFEDYCYVFGIADVSVTNAFTEGLTGLSTEGFSALEHVQDWHFVE